MYGTMHERNERKAHNRQFQEASSMRKASNDTQFFWDMVARNRGPYGAANMRRPVNKAQEEKVLFGKANVETVEHGFIDDNIPVERSGPRADEIPVLGTFAELESQVPAYVTQNIQLMKYTNPTPIQKHAVPLGLAGVDLMCCAQTGSGKTFSFMLPVVAAMDRVSLTRVEAPLPTREASGSSDALTDTTSTPEEDNSVNPEHNGAAFHFVERASISERGALPLAVVLAPTRELASQIHLDARRLLFGSNLKAVCVYGGNDLRTQLTELSTGCDLIVATPGRLNDLVDRGCVSLSAVSLLVLDEADRMLDMGFEPQIRRIIQENDMPPTGERQTFLFSATFPDEIQTLAREFLHNYVWVGVGRVGSTVENIKQQILCAQSDPNDKIKLLLGAIDQTDGRTLVFVQKRRTASWLCDCLRAQCHIKAEEIHGDRTQAQREHALKQFRDGHIRILVATDVAARGLDVPAVTHVIQFDLPLSSEDFDVYVHRIGRTGRAGMGGMATALFVPGRELGEGNGKIAPQILRLLQENGQEVPEWFAHLDDHNPGYNNRGGGNYKQRQPYGGQGGGYGNNNQQKFGWRDVRGDQNNYMYAEQQGGYHAQGQYQQGGYQQRGAGGRGQGGYGQSQGGYGQQQQGYQAQGQGGYNNRRPQQGGAYGQHGGGYAAHQQQQHQGHQGYGQQYATSEVVPGVAAYGAAVPAVADPSMVGGVGVGAAAGGYYDPYSGAYLPASPVAVDPAYGGGGSVEALGGQFGGMGLQVQAPLPVPVPVPVSQQAASPYAARPHSQGYARGPAHGQASAYGAQQGHQQQHGGRGAPRAMDSSAMPYVPQGAMSLPVQGVPVPVPAVPMSPVQGGMPVPVPVTADPYAAYPQHQGYGQVQQGYGQQQQQGGQYQPKPQYQQHQGQGYGHHQQHQGQGQYGGRGGGGGYQAQQQGQGQGRYQQQQGQYQQQQQQQHGYQAHGQGHAQGYGQQQQGQYHNHHQQHQQYAQQQQQGGQYQQQQPQGAAAHQHQQGQGPHGAYGGYSQGQGQEHHQQYEQQYEQQSQCQSEGVEQGGAEAAAPEQSQGGDAN